MIGGITLSGDISVFQIHALVGDLCFFGYSERVKQLLLPKLTQYEEQDHHTFRLACLLAPNFIADSANLQFDLASSLYTFDTKGVIKQEVVDAMLFSSLVFGGFFVIDNEIITPYDIANPTFKNLYKYSVSEFGFGEWWEKCVAEKQAIQFVHKKARLTYFPASPFQSVIPSLQSYCQHNSTYFSSLAISSFPILVRTGHVTTGLGAQSSKLLLSPLSVIDVRTPAPDSNVAWLEHSGNTHKVMSAELANAEKQLRQQCGLESLQLVADRLNESATAAANKKDFALAKIDTVCYALSNWINEKLCKCDLIVFGQETSTQPIVVNQTEG